MKSIKLKKGMTCDEVNILTQDKIRLKDKSFNGVAFKHNWVCSCNKIFNRSWRSIRENQSYDCGCVQYNKQEVRYKKEVEKNGKYEYIRSFRKDDVLPNGKIVKNASYLQIKHKYCNNIYEVSSSGFINGKNECSCCCGNYENSFAYHIEIELGSPLEKYWDFEKNTLNPYHIYKNSKHKVWIKCQEKDYHGSYDVFCYTFTKGECCAYCYNRKIHPFDSFASKYPNQAACWHEYNAKSPYEVAPKSGEKYRFRCSECCHVWDTALTNVSYGSWCPACASSKGEKRIKEYLDECEIKYVHDKPCFDDLLSDLGNPLRPDFILPEYKIWIEYDGEFHFGEQYEGDGYQTIQTHDKLKDDYAKKHGWKMIRIPYWKFDDIEELLKNKLKL